MEHTVRPRPAQSTRIRSLRPRREPPPRAPRRARGARDASRPYPAPTRSSSAGFSSNVEKKAHLPLFPHPPPQHDVHFGEGILNKGKAKKREKRPLTQIEIMAAVEREKQEKKAARKAAKVRHRSRRLPPFSESASERRIPRRLGFFPPGHDSPN